MILFAEKNKYPKKTKFSKSKKWQKILKEKIDFTKKPWDNGKFQSKNQKRESNTEN